MIVIESLVKTKNMIMVHAAQNQPFSDSASILQSNRKSMGLVSLWMLPKMSEKYRLYRFCGMCPEWLYGAFSKNESENLEITT